MFLNFANEQEQYFDSVLYQLNNNRIDAKYIDTNSHLLLDHFYLEFDYGLYQSFSASGNLRLINNQNLLTDITKMYNFLPVEAERERLFQETRLADYKTYIGSKIGIDSKGNCKLSTIIHQPDVQFFLQLYGRHNGGGGGINSFVIVIHEIDKELKDNFDYDVADKK
jgi:hypothetical protein